MVPLVLCVKYLCRSCWWLVGAVSLFLGCVYSGRWSFQFQSDIKSSCYWGRSLHWHVKSGWYRMFESGLYPAGVPSQISHVSPGKSYSLCMFLQHSQISLPGCALNTSGSFSFWKRRDGLNFSCVLLKKTLVSNWFKFQVGHFPPSALEIEKNLVLLR